MELSYAEAMKKKQTALQPTPRISATTAHPPLTMETEVTLPGSSQEDQIKEKHKSVLVPTIPSSVWRTARSVAPTPRSRQNKWVTSTTPAAAPTSRTPIAPVVASNTLTESAMKSPVRVLSKQGNHVAPWRVDSSSPKNPLPDRSLSVQSKPVLRVSQKPQKNDKPKPQKSLLVGDMIGPKMLGNGKTSSAPPLNSGMALPAAAPAFDSTTDFPALGTALIKPKPIIAKSAASSQATNVTVAAPPRGVQSKKAPKGNSNKTKSNKSLPILAVSDGRSAAMSFQHQLNIPREGDEHQLLRLLENCSVYQKRGRQRLNPRKKTFSSLKKKVLHERLKKWHELHPNEPAKHNDASCSVCIYNYVQKEDLEDDDEFREILDNLLDMAVKIGPTKQVFIPQELERSTDYPSFVQFESSNDAAAAQACWDGLVLSGSKLRVVFLDEPNHTNPWKETILAVESKTGALQAIVQDKNDTTIEIAGILTEDDYDDQDCMDETLTDLRKVAEKFGDVHELKLGVARDGSVHVTFHGEQSMAPIIQSLQNVTIGGRTLSVGIVPHPALSSSNAVVVLENVITEHDMEDEDCMEETLGDIRELAERHGTIVALEVAGTAVKIIFHGSLAVAKNCATALHGMNLAGATVIARVQTNLADGTSDHLYLHNILNKDDLEDKDCLEESLNDIRRLAAKHGILKDVTVVTEEETIVVQVTYQEGLVAVKKALGEFDGMLIGGRVVAATAQSGPKAIDGLVVSEPHGSQSERNPGSSNCEDTNPKDQKAMIDDVKPMYSGDKLIPERFAEAKRVPKIPTSTGPRPYAKIVNDESVRPLLTEMLGELMRLQKRAIEEKNAKAKRRLVLGLREVARGIRSHKVKMVVMANNLDEYGAIDEKLQEIIDLAHNEAVPLFFEFTKRGLGKAVGKTIKIAVIGIQNAEGAHQQFKKLIALASKL